MNEQVLARRYAKALITLSLEEKTLPEFYRDLKKLADLFVEMPELERMLNQIDIDLEKRKIILKNVNEKLSLHTLIQNALQLMLDRGRLYFFNELVEAFEELKYEVEKKVVAHVHMADPVTTQKTIDDLKKVLEEVVGKEVLCVLEEDPQLVGGIKVVIGDTVYDGSVKGQLNELTQQLL